MSGKLHEALQDFRSDFEPTMKAMLSSLTRTTSMIMDAYASIIDAPYQGTSDIDVKKEDTVFLADLRHHHDLLIHSVTYELDVLQTIGQPRYVERYFNFVNDDLVEVDKEHFAGLPEKDEGNPNGIVHSYGSPDL